MPSDDLDPAARERIELELQRAEAMIPGFKRKPYRRGSYEAARVKREHRRKLR
jgi:hypothetical protein